VATAANIVSVLVIPGRKIFSPPKRVAAMHYSFGEVVNTPLLLSIEISIRIEVSSRE
jgi:hypothetical protein